MKSSKFFMTSSSARTIFPKLEISSITLAFYNFLQWFDLSNSIRYEVVSETVRVWNWMMLLQIVFPKKCNSLMINLLINKKWNKTKLHIILVFTVVFFNKMAYINLQQTSNLNKKIVVCTDNLCGGVHFLENISNMNLSGCQNKRVNQ